MHYTITWSHANWCVMDGETLVEMFPCFDDAKAKQTELNKN